MFYSSFGVYNNASWINKVRKKRGKELMMKIIISVFGIMAIGLFYFKLINYLSFLFILFGLAVLTAIEIYELKRRKK